MNLGEQIKYHRKRMGLTQSELGMRFAPDRPAVARLMGRFETNFQPPRPAELLKLSQIFSVSVDELLQGTHEVEEEEIDRTVSRQRRWQRKNPEKTKAPYLARYKPEWVQILYECSCQNGKKEHHHFEYSRPYEVVLLCHLCHMAEHIRLRALEREAAEG